MKVERTVLDYPISAEVTKLEDGWDVGIFGGCRTHVGAVTLTEPDGTERTLERPGHKDSHVSRTWAARLAKEWNAPVCVRCGIHYDGATMEQVKYIVEVCNQLLEAVLQQMEGSF